MRKSSAYQLSGKTLRYFDARRPHSHFYARQLSEPKSSRAVELSSQLRRFGLHAKI
jgi:hypothetical protein